VKEVQITSITLIVFKWGKNQGTKGKKWNGKLKKPMRAYERLLGMQRGTV
jgi:hypothetical protein